MRAKSGIDWEDAFDNSGYISNAASYPGQWADRSSAFRQAFKLTEIAVPYGSQEREALDLFRPVGEPKGLVVIVHGGYWKAFDKSYWSFLAKGAVERGFAAAVPSYTLAPDATLPQMTLQIGQAVETASALVPGPIFAAGHSAGGHLVTRLICDDTPLPSSLVARIKRVVSISGLHDLRPLRLHSMNEILGLSEASAASESAALHDPVGQADVIAWIGEHERPEFLRQSSVLTEAWRGSGVKTQLVMDIARHHFNVIDGLADSSSPIMNAMLGTD